MIGLFSIASLKNAVISLVNAVGQLLLCVLVFVAFTALLMGVLPDDPFRPVVNAWAALVAPYGNWIAWVLPVRYIVTATLFAVVCKYFLWLYRKAAGVLMQAAGKGFFDV